jgi:3'-phosphoadenosine 5'-phosphosulfate sulfotransferase
MPLRESLPDSQSVMNYLEINLDALKHSQLLHWQKARYRAVVNWLTKHKPSPNAFNLEQVRDIGLNLAQEIDIFIREGQSLKASFERAEQISKGESNA